MKHEYNHRFSCGINPLVRNKSEDYKLLTTGFQRHDLTLDELVDHVKLGHAISAFYNGSRSKANFAGTQFLALDIDSGWTLAEALADDLIQSSAALIYTTVSHRQGSNGDRFRVLFLLPEVITCASTAKALIEGLLKHFPQADKNCSDVSRIYFGNSEAFVAHQRDVVLTKAFMADLATSVQREVKRKHAERGARLDAQLFGDTGSTREAEARELLAYIPPRGPRGSNTYLVARNSVYALVHEFGSEKAIELAEEWSPSDPVNNWDVEQLVNAMYKTDITFGTLKHYAYENGYTPPLVPPPHRHLPTETYCKPYLDPITLPQGLAIVKSIQGTGKTTALQQAVRGMSKVIYLTPRISLARQGAADFSLPFYQDISHLDEHDGSLAITLDSLVRLTPSYFKGCTLLVDEAVMFGTHLRGQTLKDKRDETLQTLTVLVKHAACVVLVDTDISDAEVEFFMTLMGTNSYSFIHNTCQRQGRKAVIYSYEQAIFDELIRVLDQGGKVAIATDKLDESNELNMALTQRYPNHNVLLVNSDSSGSKEVQELFQDADHKAQNIHILIYSPSMFAGIDISLPNHFETVFMFAVTRTHIHTPQSYLQALHRVRAPMSNTVHVYVAPGEHKLDTNPRDIMRSIAATESAWYELREVLEVDMQSGELRPKPHTEAYLRYVAAATARDNYYKCQPQKFVVEALAAQGYELVMEYAQGDASCREARKAAKNQEREHQRADLAALTTPTQKQAKELRKASRLTSEDKKRLLRFRYYEANGLSNDGLDAWFDTPIDRFEAIVWAFVDLRDELQYVRQRDHKANQGKSLTTGLDLRFKAAELRKHLEASYGGYAQTGYLDDAKLKDFVTFCKNNRRELKQWLGLTVRHDIETSPRKTLGEYLKGIGMSLQRDDGPPGAKHHVRYRVNPDKRERMEAIAKRHLKKFENARKKEAKKREKRSAAHAFRLPSMLPPQFLQAIAHAAQATS